MKMLKGGGGGGGGQQRKTRQSNVSGAQIKTNVAFSEQSLQFLENQQQHFLLLFSCKSKTKFVLFVTW